MDQNAVGSLALAAVACHRITVVEMGIVPDVECNRTARIEANLQITIGVDLLDGAQFSVGDVAFSIRRGELHAVAFAERAFGLAIQRDSLQTARIVSNALAVLPLDRDAILFLINAFNSGILSGFDAMRFAASRVAHHVAGFILRGPLAVRASDFLPGYQHSHWVLAISHLAEYPAWRNGSLR